MRRAPLLLWLAGASIVAAIVGGLVVVGGPGEARRERMDEQRLIDLSNIADEIAAHFGANDGALPESLSDAPPLEWNKGRRTDPESGRPYEYARLDEKRFEL
jgi:hypothetical protein